MGEAKKYHLITQISFDGFVSSILLKSIQLIDSIDFVQPKDVQDGKVNITENDITAGLPYNEKVYLAFDTHASEQIRVKEKKQNLILDLNSPSATRVIYNYFGGKHKFKEFPKELMEAVDKISAANFSQEEIINPHDWLLLNFLIDPRSNLERYGNLKTPYLTFIKNLFDFGINHSIEEILNLPDVKERQELYEKSKENFKEQITRCTTIHKKSVILMDMRKEEILYPGNRFMPYALYPTCNVSISVLWGVNKQNTVLAVGKSIFMRNLKSNIGELLLKYGGGGHDNLGTCRVENDKADEVIKELIGKLK